MRILVASILAILLSPIVTASLALAVEREDILIADFEREDYGAWQVEGEAFGPGPAKGKLPGQMEVGGYEGKRLVNSFFKGDRAVGTLTSPPVRIERKFLNFLIGGGAHKGETCINLLLDGKIVRTAVGPNDRPGGSERLQWHSWEVSDLQGKSAVLQIVDNATGGWGHVNIDHITLSDRSTAIDPAELQRTITLERIYLNLPVKNGATKRRMELLVNGIPVRAFDIELAPGEPDWWAYLDIRDWRGKEARLKVNSLRRGDAGLKPIDQTDEIKGAENLYDEPLRPQFHFSQKRGWNNDPNGMVYYDGEYHLFFQHNPYGTGWGNMHWGHAVSKDLVHWEQLPHALFPWTQAVAHCYSGSAVVDENNTAGFQTGKEKAIVAAFTDTGCGEAIAYSNDRGRTFTYYQGNPVVKHKGRDPKVFWYAPGKHWSMAVYDELEKSQGISFYTSPNLKDWTFQSRIEGFFECPEFFELLIDGDSKNSRWVLYAADAKYVLGRFDGKTFTPEHEGKRQVHWGDYYASQTFDNAPDGRRIQIGWGRISLDRMPFNQMMTFPCRLTLRTTDDGVRMFAEPVKEIELLHAKKLSLDKKPIEPEKPASIATAGRLFDIRAEFTVGDAKSFGLEIGGERVLYDAAKGELAGMPLRPIDGKIRVQILVDRPSIEVCGNDGRVYLTRPFRNEGEITAIRAFAEGGSATLNSLEVYELRSAWKR